jgi:exopolyphosphatase/guanosine-5'-triphosphate,3'-diphosphate pyrophosphatase
MKIETLAAIDIGSNAIRLLISNIEADTSVTDFKKTVFLRLPVRLGEDVFKKGKIGNRKREQLTNVMQGFSHIMKACNVSKYRACATSAMRDAANGREIVQIIQKESDIDIEIISGQEEADMVFKAGGLDKVMSKNTNYLYVDVGGGSTEVIVYSNQKKIVSESFQIGTVRMISKAVKQSEMRKFKSWLKDIHANYAPLCIIASGGNINKAHKLLEKKVSEPLIYPEIQILYNTLAPMTYEERMRSYRLDTYRADVIIPALQIFLLVCDICKIKDIYVPKVGVVDGIIHQLYFGELK